MSYHDWYADVRIRVEGSETVSLKRCSKSMEDVFMCVVSGVGVSGMCKWWYEKERKKERKMERKIKKRVGWC